MQGVTVVIRMAARVVKDVPPTQEAKDVEEGLVQNLRSKNRPVNKLMARNTAKERSHGSVEQQPDDNADPDLLQPEEVGDSSRQ